MSQPFSARAKMTLTVEMPDGSKREVSTSVDCSNWFAKPPRDYAIGQTAHRLMIDMTREWDKLSRGLRLREKGV